MTADNPIIVGFRWSQAFDFPNGFLLPGDVIRAEFRIGASDRNALASISTTNGGISVSGNRAMLTLPDETTAKFGSVQRVVTNFVIVRNGEDVPIAQIISIPVVYMPTRPTP